MITDLAAFVAAVVAQWQALVTGSLLTAVFFVVERWRAVQVPRRTMVGVFVWTYLLCSAFLAWREERSRFAALETHTSDAQELSLDQEQRMRAVLAQGKGSNALVTVLTSDKKGREFAEKIRTAFSESGWGLGSGGGNSAGSGRSLRILADDVNAPPVSMVMTAFNAANVRYRVFRVCQNTPLAIEIGEADVEKR